MAHKFWAVVIIISLGVTIIILSIFVGGIIGGVRSNQLVETSAVATNQPAKPMESAIVSPPISPAIESKAETTNPQDSPTCSPRGTATCDGQGRPIKTGNNSTGGGINPAAGVVKLNDVGLRQIALSSGGTNGLDIDPSTGLVYAVNNSAVSDWCGQKIEKRSDSLHIIDPDQAKELVAVATDKGPVWPLIDTNKGQVYVATSSEGIVALHKINSGEKLGTIKVGGLPHDLGLDPTSNLLFVSNTNDGSQKYVAVVDTLTASVVAQHQVAPLPHRIMVDKNLRVAYVVSVDSGIISIFNTENGQPAGQIETGGKGTLAYSASKRRLFVPDASTPGQPEGVRVIDAESKKSVGTIGPFLTSAGHQAFGLAVDEKNGLLYASLGDSSYVGIADLNTLKPLAIFDANACTWGIKLDEQRQRGYVTNAISGHVTMFDLGKISAELKR